MAFDYVEEENFSIEKEYFSSRVRDAHYRNQPIITLKKSQDGIIKQLGYCIDKDFPIEIVKIPKYRLKLIYKIILNRSFGDFQKLEIKLHTFNALKQLIFSKYFQKYLGFNSLSDQEYNLYFLEYTKAFCLEKIFQNVKI